MAILSFYGHHFECLWRNEVAERPTMPQLANYFRDAGINYPTRDISYAMYGEEFLPVTMVVEARQRLASTRAPRLTVRFYTMSSAELEVEDVPVLGTITRHEELNGNLLQLLQDAWVKLIQRLSTVDSVRLLANTVSATWSYDDPNALYPIQRDFPSSCITQLQRQPWYMTMLRERLGDEDIDPNEDELEDLPMLGCTAVNNPRTFGLEFEFLPNGYSQEHYGEAIREALRPFGKAGQVVVRGYAHSDGALWDLKTDSSCGYELATPALTWDNWPEVEAVLLALQAAGARIDRRCGLHVHHMANDLRATGLRRLILLWAAYERVLLAVVKPERSSNHYCRTVEEQYGSWQGLKEAMTPIGNLDAVVQDMGRYRALNATGWWQHGRIEIRLHHGTLLPGAVRFWTLLTQQMVEFAKYTRSYTEMEGAFRNEFKLQLEQFKGALLARNHQHSDVLKLATVMEEAIRRRNRGLLDGPFIAACTPDLSDEEALL